MGYTDVHAEVAYGYVPNLAANIVGVALFGIILIVQVALGLKTRDWWLLSTWGIMAGLEFTGYIARALSSRYIDAMRLYEVQTICLVIAPVFMAAGLYFQLAKEITIYGKKYSPFRPMGYNAIFTSCDVIAFFIQGGGGGVAAADIQGNGLSTGRYIVLGGMAFQVATLLTFIFFFIHITRRIHTDPNRSSNWNPEFEANRKRPLFKLWLPSVSVSLLFLLIRSIYRTVELGVGWTGYLMRTERYFLVLDGLMLVLGMAPVCVVYPALAYGHVPIEGLHKKANKKKSTGSDQKDLLQPTDIELASANRTSFIGNGIMV